MKPSFSSQLAVAFVFLHDLQVSSTAADQFEWRRGDANGEEEAQTLQGHAWHHCRYGHYIGASHDIRACTCMQYVHLVVADVHKTAHCGEGQKASRPTP